MPEKLGTQEEEEEEKKKEEEKERIIRNKKNISNNSLQKIRLAGPAFWKEGAS